MIAHTSLEPQEFLNTRRMSCGAEYSWYSGRRFQEVAQSVANFHHRRGAPESRLTLVVGDEYVKRDTLLAAGVGVDAQLAELQSDYELSRTTYFLLRSENWEVSLANEHLLPWYEEKGNVIVRAWEPMSEDIAFLVAGTRGARSKDIMPYVRKFETDCNWRR